MVCIFTKDFREIFSDVTTDITEFHQTNIHSEK